MEELGGDTSKLEECAGGTNPNLKPFDLEEYFNLPLDVGFDDATWDQK